MTRMLTRQRLILAAWGIILAQLASPVGSAVYYLASQVSYMTRAKHGSPVTIIGSNPPGDWWDRLPVHVQNLLGNRMFGIADPSAPGWWVTARHDTRHVLIGVVVAILVSSVTIGLKDRKRASGPYMITSVPLAFLVAAVVAAPLIWLSTFLPHVGVVTGNPWLADWIGKGAVQLTLIGILATLAAKKLVLARTMDTLQLMSIDQKLLRGETEKPWWRLVYPPTYYTRYSNLRSSHGYVPRPNGRLLGPALAVVAPVAALLLGYGVYLLYFGPASGAH